jgi:polyhydroxyalkanoate synthesis regulator protein
MNDQLVKDFIEKYFNQALKSFLDYQQQVEEQIRRTHGLPSVFPSVSAWTKAMLEPFASAFSAHPPASTTPPSPPNAAELQQLVRDLQAQLARAKQAPNRKPRGRTAKRSKK